MKEFPYVLEYKENFRILKNKVNLLIKKSKKLYTSKQFQAAGNNSKKTWKVINILNTLKTETTDIPTELHYNGKKISKSTDLANTFNEFYTNMAVKLYNNIQEANTYFTELKNDKSVWFCKCSQLELLNLDL